MSDSDADGLRVVDIPKEKRAAGLYVGVIDDALSNSWLQTQWPYGMSIPALTPHFDPAQHERRLHGRLLVIDDETEDGAAFDRIFGYFVRVKKSRGILDTNLYRVATRRSVEPC